MIEKYYVTHLWGGAKVIDRPDGCPPDQSWKRCSRFVIETGSGRSDM